MIENINLDRRLRNNLFQLRNEEAYQLNNKAWKQIDDYYLSRDWEILSRNEMIIRKDGVISIFWNQKIIYEENIHSLNIFAFADHASASLAFALAFAFAELALALTLAFAFIEGDLVNSKSKQELKDELEISSSLLPKTLSIGFDLD